MKNLILIGTLVLLLGCSKEPEISQLKIDFTLGGNAYGTSSESGRIIVGSKYMDFNINNYENCTSIIFVGFISNQVSQSQCFLELYNLTDSTVIQNSILSTDSRDLIWVESQDIRTMFPDKNIDLALRLRTEKEGSYVNVLTASMYINFDN